ncbi:MAG: YfiR family protein [Candidatus Competibacteraceae bacterium]|nr:MAG: YfiR family protein [Candidatus Competibacteraceae bacterium]
MVVLKPPSESASSGGGETGSQGLALGHVCHQSQWRKILAKLLLGSLLLGSNVWATEFDEYAVKAAYLYNFAKFIEWPPGAFASTDAPLWICIVGDNPFGNALAALYGKTVEKHPVAMRPISTEGFDQCHIVFIGHIEAGSFKTLLAKLRRLPILTVSDISDFARTGGMIGLVETDQHIRFDINLTATRQAGLKLSSQLLKLATIVE